jgi:hypothetical protein
LFISEQKDDLVLSKRLKSDLGISRSTPKQKRLCGNKLALDKKRKAAKLKFCGL